MAVIPVNAVIAAVVVLVVGIAVFVKRHRAE